MSDRMCVSELQPLDSFELVNVEGGCVMVVLAVVSAVITIADAAGKAIYNAAYEAGKESCPTT